MTMNAQCRSRREWERLHQRCEPMGRLEYVVESLQDEQTETWFVVRPHATLAPCCEALGLQLSPGCRVVVDACSLRPVGVLASDCPPASMPAGYNPYFDLPAA
jgi:hypothetical protein